MTHYIEHVAFDFGRVLANWDKTEQCIELARFSPLSPDEIRIALISSNLGRMHDSGQITPEKFIREARVAAHLGDDLSDEEFRRIWSDIFTPNTGVIPLLGGLRSDVGTVVISNTDPIHYEKIATLPVMQEFFSDPAKLVLSFDVGTVKPDKRMWHEGLHRLGVLAKDVASVLFIDDMPEYIDTARAIGLTAERYDCSTEPISKLEDIMNKYKLLLD